MRRFPSASVMIFWVLFVAACWATGQQRAPNGPGFQNVQVLAGVSAEEMDQIMEAANQSLGVECDYCHQVGEWHLDDKQPKRTAREMIRMLALLSTTDFQVLELPSCWTCHRGATIPEAMPAAQGPMDLSRAAVAMFVEDSGPSNQVYSNLKQYGDLPASQFRGVMESYSRALGVNCSHCHVEGDWASDAKVTKLVARRMLEIQERIGNDFFGSRTAVSCWMCHRGDATPSIGLPPDPLE